MSALKVHTVYPTPTLRLLPLRERPAYRVRDTGASACNLVELLAAIISGSQQIEIAHALLAEFGDLAGLARASTRHLEIVPGLGPTGAARLKAALGLGQRLVHDQARRRKLITSDAMAALVMPEMGLLDQEELWVILLDNQNHLLGIEMIYRGNADQMNIRPGEVFRPAVKTPFVSTIVVVHNHPSGDPTPTKEDVEVTKTLSCAGRMLGIELLDHLIIGREKFVSLRELRKKLRLTPHFPDCRDNRAL